jgi:hypothetical protein
MRMQLSQQAEEHREQVILPLLVQHFNPTTSPGSWLLTYSFA